MLNSGISILDIQMNTKYKNSQTEVKMIVFCHKKVLINANMPFWVFLIWLLRLMISHPLVPLSAIFDLILIIF